MRIFVNANFSFLAWRHAAYRASAVAIGLFVVAALVWQVSKGSWLNYGVDFAGGTVMQVRFAEATTVSDVRRTVESVVTGAEIVQFGRDEFLVRAPELAAQGGAASDAIQGALVQRHGEAGVDVVRTEAVGPKVGSELQRKATFAVLLSFIVTLIYLAFRFEWRFGVAAIIATAHDILITLGVISAFRLEVSLVTVAAVLTIIGYSLNDTIVVFDRIRENLKKSGRREDHTVLLQRSINETLPRTVLTGGSTLAALLSLFVLGGPIIRDFALIMIVGIVIGTYSSIFIASPALLEIEQRWGTVGKDKKGQPRAGSTRAAL